MKKLEEKLKLTIMKNPLKPVDKKLLKEIEIEVR